MPRTPDSLFAAVTVKAVEKTMQEHARQKRTRHPARALALSVLLVLAPMQAEGAPEGATEGPVEVEEGAGRVGLRVDTEDLGGSAEGMKAKIEEAAAGVFGAEGYVAGEGDEDPQIVVVVERTGTDENPGYVVGFSIEKGDEIVPGSARQSDCSLCTRTELLERIEEELELAGEPQAVEEVGGDGDGDVGVGMEM